MRADGPRPRGAGPRSPGRKEDESYCSCTAHARCPRPGVAAARARVAGMSRRFALLPAPADSPGANVPVKRRFLLGTWPGRILLAALALAVAHLAGLPVPAFLGVLDVLVLVIFCGWGLLSVLRFASQRLLWSMRSKLIVSYLFIAMVPVVLLGLFFFIAAVLFVDLLASHLLTTAVGRLSPSLQEIAPTAC